jgi:hypothetical protein
MERWNPCEKVLNVKNVGSLSVKWRHTIGSQAYSSRALVNVVVYVGSYNGKAQESDGQKGVLGDGEDRSINPPAGRPHYKAGGQGFSVMSLHPGG